jgi:antitoxin YefM
MSLSAAKAKLSDIIDDVEHRGAEILVTRNGRAAAMLISPDEYKSWKETAAILADKQLMREIRAGLEALRVGKARRYTIKQLFR